MEFGGTIFLTNPFGYRKWERPPHHLVIDALSQMQLHVGEPDYWLVVTGGCKTLFVFTMFKLVWDDAIYDCSNYCNAFRNWLKMLKRSFRLGLSGRPSRKAVPHYIISDLITMVKPNKTSYKPKICGRQDGKKGCPNVQQKRHILGA